MFRQTISNVLDFAQYEKNVGLEHKGIATSLRKKSTYQIIETLTINDLSFFPNSTEHPILFDDIYIQKEINKKYLKKLPKLPKNNK